jgi:transcriptional regulator with XRE-family HTH domain
MQSSSSTRKGRRAERREKILRDYQSAGLTQREFASQTGIGLSTLQLWLRQTVNRKGFIQLPNVLRLAEPTAPYRLHLGEGRTLDIASGFRPEELAALLPLLRRL